MIIVNNPQGSIRILFRYDTVSSSIAVDFKSNLLPRTLNVIHREYARTMGSFQVSLKNSTITIECPICEIKMINANDQNDSQKINATITKNQFPYLFRITNQNEEMVRDIIEGVLDVVPYELEMMRKQFKEGDYDALARTSHKVKPNFENLEEKQFTQQINEIENAALKHDNQFLNEHLETFIKCANEKISDFKNNFI